MTKVKPYWILGLIGILAVMLVPVIALWPKAAPALDNPWASVPEHPVHVAHTDLIAARFKDVDPQTLKGQDIDFVGAAGPLNLVRDQGGAHPTVGRYAIAVFGDGVLNIVAQQDVDLAQVEA